MLDYVKRCVNIVSVLVMYTNNFNVKGMGNNKRSPNTAVAETGTGKDITGWSLHDF